MEKDHLVQRSSLGMKALQDGTLDRKALNLLRLAKEPIHASSFQQNLKNYGDVASLLTSLIEDGYIEIVGVPNEQPREGLFSRLFGKRSRGSSTAASSVESATVDQATELPTKPNQPRALAKSESAWMPTIDGVAREPETVPAPVVAQERDLGGLPLPEVHDGLSQDGGDLLEIAFEELKGDELETLVAEDGLSSPAEDDAERRLLTRYTDFGSAE